MNKKNYAQLKEILGKKYYTVHKRFFIFNCIQKCSEVLRRNLSLTFFVMTIVYNIY